MDTKIEGPLIQPLLVGFPVISLLGCYRRNSTSSIAQLQSNNKDLAEYQAMGGYCKLCSKGYDGRLEGHLARAHLDNQLTAHYIAYLEGRIETLERKVFQNPPNT